MGGGNRIISGHGRKRMLDILAQEGRFGEYLDAVAAEAARRGLTPPPDGMENPVLVLRVTGGLDRREDLVRFAELSNRWGGLERSGAEFAESDARKITDALLRLYAPDASGNLLAASNRPFMAAFLKAVGATGLTNADGTPTPEAALRVQRALMTAVFGNDEKVRSMVQGLLERSQELSLASLQNALMRSAGRLLAMKRQKGSFDIVADVREAAYQYIAWRVAQQKSPKLTLAEHLRQSDFFAAEVPPMQQALARLLDAERFGKVLEKCSDLVAQQAVDAQSTFGFFEAKTPLQLLGEAERALLEEGETPVTPDPASPEAAAPEQTPPAVQAEPAPTPEAEPADPVEAAQAEIAPPEPETFVPVPAVRGTATLPGPGAEGVKAHQVNADGRPTTAVRTLPPGAWNLLRAPYDVRRPPKPSAQDRAGRGLGISAPPPATDSQGRDWGKVFPHFQGNKAEMADRTSQAIRRTMTKAERDHYSTVVDYFGGGGCWGLYHALTNFENARQLVVNEFDPDRLEKIRLLHEIDGQVADEAEAVLLEPKTLEELRALANNSSAPVTIANKVDGAIKRRVSDGRVRAVLQAFVDCAHTMLGSVTDEDGKAVDDTEAGVRKALDALREDGRKAKEAADAFKARGGSIAYRAGDAAAFDDAPSGHQVVAVCDPPYYLTQDYQQGTILGLDHVPDNWSYAATQGLLHRLADAGCAIVYTDEAWWNKKDYANAASDADMGGLFGSGILDEIAKGETFRKENAILLDIINTLDHFDVAGRVAGRQETLGVHHGHERNDEGTEDGAGRDALRPEGAADAGGERGARPSVRRVAGDLEGEGRAARGTRPHRGREGRVAIAREVIVQDIASSVEEASPVSDPAAVDALVRHSVRSVREDRMADYARAVRADARRYAEAAKRTDELPIPPEMRGNAGFADVRFSVTSAWRHDFPKAVCMTTRAALMERHGDLFRKAKAGGVRAAAQLVKAVVKPEKIAALIADHPDASIVCPVYAEEATGRNKIPRAFAKYIAKVAGIETDQGIMQSVRAFHSGANAEHRLFVSPEFEGEVTPGAEYILVDDHITQGGTVNALRDHIEANGGKVVAIAALTLSQGSSILAPRKETLDEIKRKWPDIDDLLKSADIAERADALTESQLRYILKFSTDTFRDRVAQAGREGGGQGAGRALRGREAASEGTPSEGVSRESLPAQLTGTPAEPGRARSSVTRRGSVGLANVATALFAQQMLAGKEVSARSADRLLRNIGLGALARP